MEALIRAYEANPAAGPLPLRDIYKLDVDAAVDAHPPAAKALNDPGAGEGWRKTMLRTAILLARPEKA